MVSGACARFYKINPIIEFVAIQCAYAIKSHRNESFISHASRALRCHGRHVCLLTVRRVAQISATCEDNLSLSF